MTKTVSTINDLVPDISNANAGTERGRYMVEASLRETGAGRSILADREGRIIAGNKTLEAAADMGLDIQVVQSDGRRLVVVQRTDLDLTDESGTARKLAYYDNRAGEVGLVWDAEQMAVDISAGIDISGMFLQDELDLLLMITPGGDAWENSFDMVPTADREPYQQMTFTMHDNQVVNVKKAMSIAMAQGPFENGPNENSNGNALSRICETYITDYGQS